MQSLDLVTRRHIVSRRHSVSSKRTARPKIHGFESGQAKVAPGVAAYSGNQPSGATNTESQMPCDDAVMEITDCGDLSYPTRLDHTC